MDNGHKKCKQTTRECQVLVEWKDKTMIWTELKNVKEANPIKLAEYAVSIKLNNETAFV